MHVCVPVSVGECHAHLSSVYTACYTEYKEERLLCSGQLKMLRKYRKNTAVVIYHFLSFISCACSL